MTAIALAAAPNKSPKSRRPPGPPDPPSLKGRIAAQLTGLAAEAECAELAEGAGDPEISADTVRQFMAHQLAAGHGLAMGLTGRARRLVRECAAESGGDEPTSRRSLELLRFVAGTARMMERCRAAAIALDRIGYPARPEGPDDGGPHRCDHPHHYAWRLSNERIAERRRVLDWLGQGKKPSAMPGVDDWPPYHNPDPDIEKLDERLATAPRRATPGLKRGRLKNGNPVGDYMKAPRCGAKTRRNGCCRQPAMSNGRCRFHGGKSTGPRTDEGLRRSRTARLTHGFRSAEVIDLRSAAARVGRNLRVLTRVAKQGVPASPSLLSPRKRGSRAAVRLRSECVHDRTLKSWTPAFAGEASLGMAASNASAAGHGVHRSDFPPRWRPAKALRRVAG